LKQVVGVSNDGAFWTDTVGVAKNLGSLGSGRSQANDITDAGLVVGWSDTLSAGQHAFVWSAVMGMRDLNNMIAAGSNWTLIEAKATNAAGQIVGYGVHNGQVRGFLLIPTP
jgi:probable HAF family extracellular repeat protein